MTNRDKISTRLQELTAFIEEAQKKLARGEVVTLSHLDAEVAQLCDQALKLPPEDAVKVQPMMADMIAKLEELGTALKSFQTNLKSKI